MADLLAQWDPDGQWSYQPVSQLIQGGQEGSLYGPLHLQHLDSGVQLTIQPQLVSSPAAMGLSLAAGVHHLVAQRLADGSLDTMQLVGACLTTDHIYRALQPGQQGKICLDTSELPGALSTTQNICAAANPSTKLWLDPSGRCLQYVAQKPGVASGCYVLCDNFGVCDTTYVTLKVLAAANASTTANDDHASNDGPATDSLVIFDGFSPNGDGVNDFFTIMGLDRYPDHLLRIFNRWGNEVFQAAPYRNDWDGSWNGRNLPDGTYFYLLDLGNGTVLKGMVVLRR
ncbi:MAG: hypothetical protein KatS3mg029_0899 [Saprospiraceae bacterium]|nr:MAG: hypothetical protein KatS3mg029_0899 [Saprospiraceae bacterium]